ncbi:MAG: AAA family ATPase [Kofleriaceae bacterium]
MPITLHPRGTLRSRFEGTEQDAVFRRLGLGARACDLGDEGLYLAEEIVAADKWFGGSDPEALGILVLALMIVQRQGSSRLPLDPSPRGQLATLVKEILHIAGYDANGSQIAKRIHALTARPGFNSVIGVGDARLPLIVDDNCLYTERARYLEGRVALRLAERIAPLGLVAKAPSAAAAVAAQTALFGAAPAEPKSNVIQFPSAAERKVIEANARFIAAATAKRDEDLIVDEPVKPPLITAENEPKLTEEQRRAVQLAISGRISVVTGGPGTGKTLVAAAIVRGFQRMGIKEIALAAPTGKAANRLTEVIAKELASHPQAMELAAMARAARPTPAPPIRSSSPNIAVPASRSSSPNLGPGASPSASNIAAPAARDSEPGVDIAQRARRDSATDLEAAAPTRARRDSASGTPRARRDSMNGSAKDRAAAASAAYQERVLAEMLRGSVDGSSASEKSAPPSDATHGTAETGTTTPANSSSTSGPAPAHDSATSASAALSAASSSNADATPDAHEPSESNSSSTDASFATPVAQTLHRLLGYRVHGFAHHARSPLPVGAVIVDEASMIDLELVDALLDALPPSAPLVLIGDAHQLPAVDAGRILADLADPDGAAAARVATLHHSHRMDAADPRGRQVLEAAQAIHRGDPAALFMAKNPLATPRTPGTLAFSGVEWVDSAKGPQVARQVTSTVWHHFGGPRAQEIANDIVFQFDEGTVIPEQAAILDDLWHRIGRARILTATRGMPTGARALNAHLHELALDNMTITGKPEFVPGEPVMITANDYQRGLFNGDQGIIIRADEGTGHHRYRAVFRVNNRLVPFAIEALRDRLELAWALTIHKSQGSELEAVAIVLPDEDLPLITRELIYTGITRARYSVVLCGSRAGITKGATRIALRHSGLADRMRATLRS